MPNPRSCRRWLLVALAAHVILAGTYAWRVPAWEGPDEGDHAYYSSFLQATGRQPIILGSATRTGRPPYEEASLGHHPPLYYWLVGKVAQVCGYGDVSPYWAPNPAWASDQPTSALKWQHGHDEVTHVSAEIWVLRAQRAISVLLGAGTIGLAFALARTLFVDRPRVASLTALLLAAWPQWSFTHGVLDNGNLATTLATATTLVLVCAVQRGTYGIGPACGLGALLGAALLTKLTALFLLPLVGVALAVGWLTRRAPSVVLVRFGVVTTTVAAAISGAWFWRNQALYGDPLALAPHALAYASNRVPDGMRWSYLSGDFLWRTLHSSFAAIGWGARTAPAVVEVGAGLGVCLGVLVCASRARAWARGQGAGLAVTIASIALTTLGLVQFNLTFIQPQGRYLFPAFAAFVTMVAAGLDGLRFPVWGGALALLGGGALQHSWFLPQLALGAPPGPFYASYEGGLRAPPAPTAALLQQLAPPPDHRSQAPPQFQWRDQAPAPVVAYTLQFALPEGVTFGTWETAQIALPTTAWTPPAAMWATFPSGVPLRWRVRRVADRSRGEGFREQASSPWLTVTRD